MHENINCQEIALTCCFLLFFKIYIDKLFLVESDFSDNLSIPSLVCLISFWLFLA